MPKTLNVNPFCECHCNDDCDNENVLEVLNVDLCLEKNSKDHNTDHFYAIKDTLIVRRGETFRLRIRFNRSFNPTTDAISFIFTVADAQKVSPGNGTMVGLALRDGIDNMGEASEWSAGIEHLDDIMLNVLIKPSVTCPVTAWKLDIDTKLKGNGSRTFTVTPPIYILFNPWCPADQVYLPNYNKRKEYVMQDTTLIWRGNSNCFRPSVWKLGQFERDVLECSIKLLGTVGRLSPASRGDAVRVARAIASAVNAPDDNGIVAGNWSEDFEGGTAPTKWTGSTKILQEFHSTQKPVKFGQCWVFGGVVGTIARALGIPTRVVTCFSAAHDTDGSLTVDVFVDQNDKECHVRKEDSIWNYHVWNELWMDRPDLGVGPNGSYSGWQVVDATPQETSDGMYRVGPTSVLAVKNGEILRPFDGGFVFSAVNADQVYWRYNGPKKPIKLLRTDTLSVGNFISTKAVLQWERDDITANYKYQEKTPEERSIMLKALKQAQHDFSRYYINENFNDIDFKMKIKDDIQIGEKFSVIVKVSNKSTKKSHTAFVKINCNTVSYTGINSQEVKCEKREVHLKPNSSENLCMNVEFDEYFGKLSSQAAFNISCAAEVKDTDYHFYAKDDFRVRKPDIKFNFDGPTISQQPMDVILRLTNPLPIPIGKGKFFIEGRGIEKPLSLKIAEIPVGETATTTFKYTPPCYGCGTLLAKFSSKELDDVDGYMHYTIKPRP